MVIDQYTLDFIDALIESEVPSVLEKIKQALEYSGKYNSEQLASKLLFETARNTGFETDKGHLGECFTVDCCEWESRQSDDICGLDDNRITCKEKMKIIYEKSILIDAFKKAGI